MNNTIIERLAPAALAVLALALGGGCATVRGGAVQVESQDATVSVVFGERERRLIREYYARHTGRHDLPPGLAKRESLPPGLQRRLVRGEPLPPGLRWEPLPPALQRRLGPPPPNAVRVRIGVHVVLLDADTRVVLDMVQLDRTD